MNFNININIIIIKEEPKRWRRVPLTTTMCMKILRNELFQVPVYLSGNHVKIQLSVKLSNDTGHYKMGVWFLLCSGSEKHDLSHQLERFHGCNNKHSAVRRLCAHTLTQPGRNRGNLEAFGASSRSGDAEEEGRQHEEVEGRVSSPIMDHPRHWG